MIDIKEVDATLALMHITEFGLLWWEKQLLKYRGLWTEVHDRVLGPLKLNDVGWCFLVSFEKARKDN